MFFRYRGLLGESSLWESVWRDEDPNQWRGVFPEQDGGGQPGAARLRHHFIRLRGQQGRHHGEYDHVLHCVS